MTYDKVIELTWDEFYYTPFGRPLYLFEYRHAEQHVRIFVNITDPCGYRIKRQFDFVCTSPTLYAVMRKGYMSVMIREFPLAGATCEEKDSAARSERKVRVR